MAKRVGEKEVGTVDRFPFCDWMGVQGGFGIVPTYVCVSTGTGARDIVEGTPCGLTV